MYRRVRLWRNESSLKSHTGWYFVRILLKGVVTWKKNRKKERKRNCSHCQLLVYRSFSWYPVTSFHGQIVPLNSHIAPQYGQYYLDYPDIEWTCSLCSLPFRFEQSLVGVENLTQHGGESEYANEDVAGYANDLPEPWIIQERKRNTTDLMMVHLNINSCQNKLDDLILLNKKLKSRDFSVRD